ncbi:MAG: DUF2202 domain-containing protein [Bacteroidota bacterium]
MKQTAIVLATLSLFIYAGCDEGQASEPLSTDGTEIMMHDDLDNLEEQIASYPKEDMKSETIEGLLYMREEEKVARDVYIALGNKWNLRVFKNISRSEQRHMDALLVLIERYGLTDPIGENKEGIFTNADLQAMYDDLIAKGTLSIKDAMETGVLIEETDIKDLDEQLTNLSEESDIAFVYRNLKSGSENHLAAFTRNLERLP